MISEDGDDEDNVVFLEERNVGCATSDLPHLRSQCVKHKFEKKSFVDICRNCYCYICDIVASDCKKWSTHCEATNEGQTKNLWKKVKDDEVERQRIADGKPVKKRKTILSYFAKVVPVSNIPVPSDSVYHVSPSMPVEGPLSPEKNPVLSEEMGWIPLERRNSGSSSAD